MQDQRLIFTKHGVDAGKAGMQAKAPAQVQKPILLARFRQHQRAAQLRKTGFRIGLYRVKPIQAAPQQHNYQPCRAGRLRKGKAHPRQGKAGAQAKQQGPAPNLGKMRLAHRR